jgi:sarcosine oxidase subunit delta
MRIPCPCCGERDVREFSCLGDAGPLRPAADDAAAFFDYVYLRTNPAGLHNELWYHAAGCHSWLVVTRNTVTHEIASVVRAADRQAQ